MLTISMSAEVQLATAFEGNIWAQGEMAQLIRERDWSTTPLGPIERWSPVLRASVNTVLGAPIPMQLFWGPELMCLYNDAMAPALSDKHPHSLGHPAREVWREAWDTIGVQLEDVLHRGRPISVLNALVPLLHNGVLEDQYWTYSYSPVWDEQGRIVGVLDVAQNTTEAVLNRRERDQAVDATRRSEGRFRALIDRASIGINIGDDTGALSYLNQTLLDLLGYTAEEVQAGAVRWDEITPDRYAEADRRALAQLRDNGVAEPYEKSYRAKSGRLVPMQVGAVMIPALAPEATSDDIAVFFTDLTNQKKAEAALLQAEKVGAVGKLASAISHEINNPLEAITNILYIVRNLSDLPQSARDYLDVADRELARVSQVTAQTLSYHRLSTSALCIFPDLMLEEVLQLYASRLENYRVEVSRRYAPGTTLTCFEGDVRQVINNLVGNALSFMRNGGRLSVRTREATRWSTGQKGILITVADSGEGIAPEAKQHLFEAFYTTKGIHGTGLGLWVSCRIVHKHRGYIRAHNAILPEHGAVFQLWLPSELAPSAHEPWHVLAGDVPTVTVGRSK